MSLRFIDICAGLGGFNQALSRFGFECVFASEINEELRENYKKNFPQDSLNTYGNIREFKHKIPKHDILCAGFPCQPFSKSGHQKGFEDETEGTIFHEILDILKKHKPKYIFLENVGNFERHDSGRTWQIVKNHLTSLGYNIRGTTHIGSGGSGLLSPHHLGFPHHRERFFIIGSLDYDLPEDPFPKKNNQPLIPLKHYIKSFRDLSKVERSETKLSEKQTECIDHWNKLLTKLPKDRNCLPSFPIWSDEFEATYPFENSTPYVTPIKELRRSLRMFPLKNKMSRDELLEFLPNYARTPTENFPEWKVKLIRKNRNWFCEHSDYFDKEWLETLRKFPPSLRKLEWNCHGEKPDLWKYILQFRPSGLRIKRYSFIPSLVAMTETQIPILGPKKRFLSRTEGLLLLGFSDSHTLPISRASAFTALGNGIHVDVVSSIFASILSYSNSDNFTKTNSRRNSKHNSIILPINHELAS